MKMMKYLILGLLFSLPFALAAQTSMTGDWKLELPDGNGNLLTFKVSMKADNTYIVDLNNDGTSEVQGKYTVEGDQITMEDTSGEYACTGQKGIYKFVIEGDKNTLSKVSDACPIRGGNGQMIFMRWK